jgi:hypothetical protein
MGFLSILYQNPSVVFRRDEFVPHGRAAESARVIILLALGQDNEEALANADGLLAPGAVKFSRVKILVSFPCHQRGPFTGMPFAFSSHTAASLSLGARQSPRGESDPPEPTLGPLGTQERLNWLVWKNR